MNIQIVLFDGFDLLDVIAPYEVFTAAAMYSSEEITVEKVLDGNLLKWSMKVTKPMRLTLKFVISMDENNKMYGEAKAGMLPSSKLIGQRLS